jgi:DNA-binding transcriptional MerR regulator
MEDTGRRPIGGAAREGSGSGAERLLTIGQVVRELQSDFPDLSISKVRYLEDRGLLAPTRTTGRYRKYSKADVRSLRGILTMQRDDYLPLEVIRQRVERRGSAAAMGRPSVPGSGVPRLTMKLIREEPTYTLEDLSESAGVDDEFVLTLVEFRIIDRSSESGPAFTESDLDTVRVCQRLAHFDLEPRNLRLLSSSAEREAALVEQVASPSLRSGHPDRKEYGLTMVEDLASLFSQLMHLLLHKELRRLL